MNATSGIVVSPSAASADPLCLYKAIKMAEAGGCQDIHIDIEDGNFVPNITFGEKTVRAVCEHTSLPLSFHLMVSDQLGWLRIAAKYRPSIVFGHIERLPYPRTFGGLAKRLGVRYGFALNPKSSVAVLQPYVQQLDGVLLLSVEPDGEGELFMETVYDRIRDVRAMDDSVEIWVDGNVTLERLPVLCRCGATHAVLGRAFYQRAARPL